MTRLFAASATALMLVTLPAQAEPVRHEIDPEHVTVAFLVGHIGYAKQLGVFREVEGEFTYDAASQSVSDLTIEVETDSVWTNHRARDNHLRGSDFMDSGAHPKMTFVLTDAQPISATTGTITGDLTLRGVTRPLTLEVTKNKVGKYPFGHKKEVVGLSARGSLLRSEFGMRYALDGELVGDQVDLIIEVEAIRDD